MHIPDGYLGPATYGGLWAVMAGIWSYAARRVKKDLPISQVPYLAMASAFSFVAMIFAIPLPGGTTAHITGAALIAVLIGPWAAVIAVSVSLMIQALVFGDGGVTALSANCFNIAFVGTFAGYGLYRLITTIISRFVSGKNLGTEPHGSSRWSVEAIAAAMSAYAGMNAAALFTALELGLQPLIYGPDSAGSGYFPYSPAVAIPAVMLPHLTLIGPLEAVVAALVVTFMGKSKNLAGKLSKTSFLILISLFLFLPAKGVLAHDFFIEPKGDEFLVVFGHGKQREEFDVSKVKQIKALDPQGTEIPVQRIKKESGLSLKLNSRPAVITVAIDNGYWSKTIYGWKELPKRKASRVVEAIRSFFYSKMILSWNEVLQTPFNDAGLDIVLLKNPFEPKPGNSLMLKVFLRGQPLPGADIIGSDHSLLGKTDKDGIGKIPLLRSQNLLTVEYKERLKDDLDADVLSLTATLTFEVKR